MANAPAPYEQNGRWYIDKDANDIRWYVANVTKDLTDSATTAASFQALVTGVALVEQQAPQGPSGGLLAVKLSGMGSPEVESKCVFRVTCANGEQFDRTIWFKEVEN
jgi:hypothetical protein